MSEENTGNGIMAIGISLLFIIGGLGLAYVGYMDYRDTQSSIENSVETEGVITSIDITEDRRRVERNDRTRYETVYRTSIEYDYTYQGNEYSGSGLTASDIKQDHSSRASAEETLDGYEEGETTTVYVDSRNPSDSFLEKRGSNKGLILSAIGLVLALLGGGLGARTALS